MRPAQSHLALRSVALFVLMFSSSRYLGTALNYQLKNATSSRHRLFSRRHLNSVANSNTNVESQTYTQTVIANFMKSLPPLGTAEVIRILEASIEQHKVLPNVIRLKVPVINRPAVTGSDVALTEISSYTEGTPEIQYGNFSICGDTHGQFFDVMNIFSDKVGGFPTRSNAYLFNGDFVDRGMYSIEVILTLLAIKLSDPTAMNLLRGNHETILMNDMFGFTKEVKTKYPNDHKILLPLFQILFCSLPIAAVVENQVFVTHGGIGPSIVQMTLADLDRLDRFKEPTFDDHEDEEEIASEQSVNTGVDNISGAETVIQKKAKEFCPPGMSELLWSDPMDLEGFRRSQRGGGVTTFGRDVTNYFLDRNDLSVMTEGYEFSHSDRCVTVFSAPDYCGGKNLGALMRFNNAETMMLPTMIAFSAVGKMVNK